MPGNGSSIHDRRPVLVELCPEEMPLQEAARVSSPRHNGGGPNGQGRECAPSVNALLSAVCPLPVFHNYRNSSLASAEPPSSSVLTK